MYCSYNCYDNDPSISPKSVLHSLGFKSALSSTKTDTNALVNIMGECMGLGKFKRSKEYLEDFFNNIDLRENNSYSNDDIKSTKSKKQLNFWE